MSAEMERINHMVLGIGLNVNQDEGDFPADVKQTATSLLLEGGGPLPRVNLLKNVLASLERWYDRWLEEGFQPVLARWKDLSVTLGRPVRIHSLNESWEGWAEDVDEEGALVLRLPDGSHRRVISGEVSLRL
jgi:BirA family biotin operon repressor/biotin-[acetyl-CoA-carboxylase] ligase